METKELSYKPHKSGFPYKLLKYLWEHGECAGVDAQKEIGVNSFFDSKGTIYYDRASATFDMVVKQLQQKGLIKFLPNDHYKLTKVGKEFISNYKLR